jgi:ligand-binding sensor domain-containing protein
LSFIAVDRNNVKWFGTEDREFAFSTELTGAAIPLLTVSFEQINGIAVDQNKIVWFATTNGIATVDAIICRLLWAMSKTMTPPLYPLRQLSQPL